MSPRKKSFFEKLTGAVNTNDFDETEEVFDKETETKTIKIHPDNEPNDESDKLMEEEESQLSVDVYQNENEIIIKTMIAGVKPDTLDIQISRDMVTLHGSRKESNEIKEEDYFYRELFWGTFSRTILLPSEIDVEEAEATEEHGLLTLRLPKIDKDRKTKLKVRSSR